jgi:stearoyl-CoA desaturase (delta-9 desaturase)
MLSRIRWFNLAVLALTPAFAIYGMCTTHLTLKTALFSAFYYIITMLGQSCLSRGLNV